MDATGDAASASDSSGKQADTGKSVIAACESRTVARNPAPTGARQAAKTIMAQAMKRARKGRSGSSSEARSAYAAALSEIGVDAAGSHEAGCKWLLR